MGCQMSKKARKNTQQEVDGDRQAQNIDYIGILKRAQLQKLCKKHKLKANGKNTELVARLRCHFEELNQNLATSSQGQIEDASSPDVCPEEKVGSDKWCVVEGTMKSDDEAHWHEIVLKGGSPVVSNQFGKLIPFLLEPSVAEVPKLARDNLICGSCVRKNEELRSKGFTRARKQPSRKQGCSDTSKSGGNHKENHLSGSVKRKRLEPESTALKRQKKDPTSSQPLTPANPEVRRARGGEISLAKKLIYPWKCQEDPDFAKRVEAIIRTTVAGSQEERDLVMRATRSPVQHSPTKV